MPPAPILKISADEKRFLMESALLLRDTGRPEEAAVVFDALIDLVEDRHLPHIGLGSIAFERGDFDRAVEQFEAAVAAAPGSALAHAHLGEALAFGRHREEAELELQKAVQLDPSGTNGGNMAKTIQRFLSFGLL